MKAADRTEAKLVYDAEDQVCQVLRMPGQRLSVHGTEIVIPTERRFGDYTGVQRYVDAVQGLNWFKARWPGLRRVRVVITTLKTRSKANYSRCEILIANQPHHLTEMVVLHELAHLCTGPGHGHDAVFRATFCDLLTDCIGPEIGWLMSVRYMEAGLTVG